MYSDTSPLGECSVGRMYESDNRDRSWHISEKRIIVCNLMSVLKTSLKSFVGVNVLHNSPLPVHNVHLSVINELKAVPRNGAGEGEKFVRADKSLSAKLKTSHFERKKDSSAI